MRKVIGTVIVAIFMLGIAGSVFAGVSQVNTGGPESACPVTYQGQQPADQSTAASGGGPGAASWRNAYYDPAPSTK